MIITVIVMLILVVVTINVALKGELFTQAQIAVNDTQIEADREQLLSLVVGAIGADAKVEFGKLDTNLATIEWTGSNGTYTSPKENIFTVDENGTIEYKGKNNSTEDLAYLKEELEGKGIISLIEFDQDYNMKFKNEQIENIGFSYNGPDSSNVASMVLKYNNRYYDMIPSNWNSENAIVEKIQANAYAIDINGNFQIYTEGTNAIISGLLKKGVDNLATTKKLVIPATIKGTNGIVYNVTEIGRNPFDDYKTDIEELEFESGSNLKKLGVFSFAKCTNLSGTINLPEGLVSLDYMLFDGCTSIEKIIIPSSVQNISQFAFNSWRDSQTIIFKGKSEEPALTDPYSGIGFEQNWRRGCNANIIWEE